MSVVQEDEGENAPPFIFQLPSNQMSWIVLITNSQKWSMILFKADIF